MAEALAAAAVFSNKNEDPLIPQMFNLAEKEALVRPACAVPVAFTAPPTPLLTGDIDRLDISCFTDSMINFIESEADELLAPEFAAHLKTWVRGILPLSKHDMLKLYVKMDQPSVPFLLDFKHAIRLYTNMRDRAIACYEDATLSVALRLSMRFHMLMAASTILSKLSLHFYSLLKETSS